MEYLHTMVRISDIDTSLDFYCTKLGLKELYRYDSAEGRFTNIFLYAPGDAESAKADKRPLLELTYNWPATLSSADAPETEAGKHDEENAAEELTSGRNFGHLAYRVDDIYGTCRKLMDAGVTINRPPRDGRMSFIKSPDGISIELLQKGDPLPSEEPWASMENTGSW